MTTTVSPESAARIACRASGLPGKSLRPLHHHATSVFLLDAEDVVVRVSSASQRGRLETSVLLTRWLIANGFPATEPADVRQPVVCASYTVTFWRYYPQTAPGAPAAHHLGSLLRSLHDLPVPPFELPEFQPLSSLKLTLSSSTCLTAPQREWLSARQALLLEAYRHLEFPLGYGHIHADAYPGNMLWDAPSVRLGDWDEAAIGPREVDLANTFQGVRFGRSVRELDEFSLRYGYDIRNWSGLPVLREIRDLHTLGSFIRRADHGDEAAARQLNHRIATLMNEDSKARWSAA
ncbi:aminoglycoside phosphotransferase family protein [Streptomyces canus]|uniref:aminoglycoside phosphotransferase family protein n=1 Tax=Streptomyces canus TaxID=58343 RepID=UPI0036EEC16E